jgi:hypothetical protein
VTAVRDVLEQAGRWDPAHLRISFTPVTPATTTEAPPGAEPHRSDLRAGQVAVVVT